VARLHEAHSPADPTTGAADHVDHAYGDEQGAIEYVAMREAAGATEMMGIIPMGTGPQEVCMETIQRWDETTIPHVRAKESRAAVEGAVDLSASSFATVA
jgi:hypothetical protein